MYMYDNRVYIVVYRHIVTTLYRTQKYLFQDAKKNENVQFDIFIFNEMVKVYFSFFIKRTVSFFYILSPVALCVVFV